ncbi:MAG: SET domain-containing protein [Flavobacterium sp.]|jgi:SET domain-containing protein
MENDNQIEAQENDYLYLKESQVPNSGRGLFTAIEIYKEEIIAYFNGEILSYEESQLRAKNTTASYFMNLPNGTILDCYAISGFAKYANDAKGFSKSEFKNNALITLDDNGKVCLIAKRKIKSEEEIFCSYGKKYWEKELN